MAVNVLRFWENNLKIPLEYRMYGLRTEKRISRTGNNSGRSMARDLKCLGSTQ